MSLDPRVESKESSEPAPERWVLVALISLGHRCKGHGLNIYRLYCPIIKPEHFSEMCAMPKNLHMRHQMTALVQKSRARICFGA